MGMAAGVVAVVAVMDVGAALLLAMVDELLWWLMMMP
jgi:hypothetical protein